MEISNPTVPLCRGLQRGDHLHRPLRVRAHGHVQESFRNQRPRTHGYHSHTDQGMLDNPSIINMFSLGRSQIQRIREDKSRVVVMGAPDFPIAQYCYKTVCNSALLGLTRGLRFCHSSASHGIDVYVNSTLFQG